MSMMLVPTVLPRDIRMPFPGQSNVRDQPSGFQNRLYGAADDPGDPTRMVDIQLVGSYAVAPTWGDGHHTGYYTYALLRERCPCGTCSAGRAGATSASPTAERHPDHASPSSDKVHGPEAHS